MAFIKRVAAGSKERLMDFIHPEPTLFIGSPQVRIDERDIRLANEFKENGYRVTFLDEHSKDKTARDKDLGIGASTLSYDIDEREKFYQLLQLRQPARFTFDEILQKDEPLVAKDITEDRGESVFLLQNREAIRRFLLWKYTFNLSGLTVDALSGNAKSRMQKILEGDRMIRNKRWNWEGFKDMVPEEGWKFEEFVETPSNYYTSFRILADGYGNVHYGTLLRSAEEKGKRPLNAPRPAPENPALELLYKQGSNFQLSKTPNIVSNAYQGGIGIQLNGEKVTNDIDREVLKSHDIDPDNPQIPIDMAQSASDVAYYMRLVYPWIGSDFIYNQELNRLFLEANAWPMLFAAGLGISQEDIKLNLTDPDNKDEVRNYLNRTLVKATIKRHFPNNRFKIKP